MKWSRQYRKPLEMQVWRNHPSPANTTNWVPSRGGRASGFPLRGVMRSDGARVKKQVWRPPCSDLRSFGSKCAVEENTWDFVKTFRRLIMIRRPGNRAPLAPPRYASASTVNSYPNDIFEVDFFLKNQLSIPDSRRK